MQDAVAYTQPYANPAGLHVHSLPANFTHPIRIHGDRQTLQTCTSHTSIIMDTLWTHGDTTLVQELGLGLRQKYANFSGL